MQLHDLSASDDVLERVTRCARRALAAYGCHPGTTVRLLNVSENATYLVTDPDAGLSICGGTGSATTPSRRSRPSWPGWRRCGPRPGCTPPGSWPPPTAAHRVRGRRGHR